ncbi:MAG: DUF1963 domain-containing protein [Planctomycetaceae bacterium]|nr:DUF1963 domain-containing protein [Planctomycetaceae bacterium]
MKAEGNWSVAVGADAYQSYLSSSECTKIGGYPDWIQRHRPSIPNCEECGKPMEFFQSFGSGEFDGVTWGRWCPIEERDALNASPKMRLSTWESPGWMFGDSGQVYVFICRHCKDWPIRSMMQCC